MDIINQNTEHHQLLKEKIGNIKTAMMTSKEADHSLRSRPMVTLEMDLAGALWFFTNNTATKVDEIQQDNHVNLSYVDEDKRVYISVSGHAHLIKDPERVQTLWNPMLKTWFPQGLDDPNLALFKVIITQAEYWEVTGGKLAQFIGITKAAITGDTYEAGKHHKIIFS